MLESSPEYQELRNEQVHEEMAVVKEKVEKEMTLGDIGEIALGRWGVRVVNVSLVLTQLGFCTAYIIFIVNTIHQMFPLTFEEKTVITPSPLVDHTNVSLHKLPNFINNQTEALIKLKPAEASNSSTMIPPMIGTSSAPLFALLALIPLPVLILMAFIRKIRLLGPISGIANVALLSGFVGLLAYMLNGM